MLLWWLPIVSSLWTVVFLGLPQPLTAPGVGISDASRTEILILSLLALACSGWRPDFKALRLSDSAFWLALFLVWVTLSSLASSDQLNSLFFSQSFLAAACVYLALPRLCPRRLSPVTRVCLLHLPVLVICMLALTGGQSRVSGPFQLPGVLANWLLLVVPLLFREYLQTRAKLSWMTAIPTGLAILTILLTYSRAAYLVLWFQLICLLLLEASKPLRWFWGCAIFWASGLAAVVLLRGYLLGVGLLASVAVVGAAPLGLLLVQRQLAKSLVLKAAILLLGVYAAFGLVSQQRDDRSSFVVHRWTDLAGSDNSATSRVEFWRAGLELAREHPVLGVGPGRYGEAYPQVQRLYYYFSDSAHCAGIELMAEVGLLGAGLLLVALLLELRRLRLAPDLKPWQRGALLGTVSAVVYAQFEVGYHFAYLWVSLAMVMSLLSPRLREQAGSSFSWGVGIPAILLALLLSYPLAGQRLYLISQQEGATQQAYAKAREVSDRFTHWSAPAHAALAYGLRSQVDPRQLQLLAQRVLRSAPSTAITYKFAGDVAYELGDYSQASTYYQQSLALDRFNHPGSYHGLLLVAEKTTDSVLREQIQNEVLALYDLSLLRFAHTGHRDQLMVELRPLLYDLADSLNPYEHPVKTESIYRFLVSEDENEPRALHGLGVSLWAQGRPDEGRPYLERAHRLNPLYPAPP